MNNRLTWWSYDLAGNVTAAWDHVFQYDATGQQTWSAQTSLSQAYDDDRLPV